VWLDYQARGCKGLTADQIHALEVLPEWEKYLVTAVSWYGNCRDVIGYVREKCQPPAIGSEMATWFTRESARPMNSVRRMMFKTLADGLQAVTILCKRKLQVMQFTQTLTDLSGSSRRKAVADRRGMSVKVSAPIPSFEDPGGRVNVTVDFAPTRLSDTPPVQTFVPVVRPVPVMAVARDDRAMQALSITAKRFQNIIDRGVGMDAEWEGWLQRTVKWAGLDGDARYRACLGPKFSEIDWLERQLTQMIRSELSEDKKVKLMSELAYRPPQSMVRIPSLCAHLSAWYREITVIEEAIDAGVDPFRTGGVAMWTKNFLARCNARMGLEVAVTQLSRPFGIDRAERLYDMLSRAHGAGFTTFDFEGFRNAMIDCGWKSGTRTESQSQQRPAIQEVSSNVIGWDEMVEQVNLVCDVRSIRRCVREDDGDVTRWTVEVQKI
jgi:hypothetical protein